MTALILYTGEHGRSRVQLRAHKDTVWLTPCEIAESFKFK